MQTPRSIYREYRINQGLQMHQLRVAAVSKHLCDHSHEAIDAHSVIVAGLFHDMGNIIKSDLPRFPEFLEPEGLDYWRHIKTEFIQKYGMKTHEANVKIAKEIKLPASAIVLIDGIGFSNIEKITRSGTLEQKIVEYADCRVGPYGVMDLHARQLEARKRYLESGKEKEHYTETGFMEFSKVTEELEALVCSTCGCDPKEITDELIAPIIEELRDYKVY